MTCLNCERQYFEFDNRETVTPVCIPCSRNNNVHIVTPLDVLLDGLLLAMSSQMNPRATEYIITTSSIIH